MARVEVTKGSTKYLKILIIVESCSINCEVSILHLTTYNLHPNRMSKLHSLKSITSRSAKRVGRGYGSGVGGHTSGRGSKGQHARNSVPLWFEGGQLPLIKRLPMLRGKGRLKSLASIETITLSQLDKLGKPMVTVEILREAKMIDRRTKDVKVVATGEISKKVQLDGIQVSEAAQKAIEKAGGSVK